MNKKESQSYLEHQKQLRNEASEENVIFDEVQIGPLEEGILTAFPFDTSRYEEYKRFKILQELKREINSKRK